MDGPSLNIKLVAEAGVVGGDYIVEEPCELAVVCFGAFVVAKEVWRRYFLDDVGQVAEHVRVVLSPNEVPGLWARLFDEFLRDGEECRPVVVDELPERDVSPAWLKKAREVRLDSSEIGFFQWCVAFCK